MNAGVIAGIVIALFGAVFLVRSFDYPYRNPLIPGPGPAFFPVWLNVILIIVALLYIYESFKGKNKPEEEMPSWNEFKQVLYIVACMVVFIATADFLGFILSSTLFLFLLLFRSYKWYSSLGISFGISVALFLLFAVVLNVKLPVNGLGW